MVSFSFRSILVAAILTIGGMSVANAQVHQGSVLKVDIPNTFVIKGKTFAPGQYTIERTPSTIDSPSLMILRDANGGNGIVFDTTQTRTQTPAQSTQVIFDSINGTYFLSQIWVKGSTTSNDLPMTSRERRMIAQAPVHKVVMTSDTGF